MIKRRYVTAMYIEEPYCNTCGGRMIDTGVALTSYPVQYVYKCEKCKNEMTTCESFGAIKYEFEDEDKAICTRFCV